MKELYLNAEMEIVKFSVEDVITTSGDPDEIPFPAPLPGFGE